MSPLNDRRRSDADEEKPRNTRRYVEAPRKRPAEHEQKRDADDKPRRGGRRQDAEDWDDELDDGVGDFDDDGFDLDDDFDPDGVDPAAVDPDDDEES